ncbi:hypothetical protein N7527_009032 [Penicillium freii]|nr:hypothetical protein N7527_009032 [Penicillium freii]
MTGNTIQGYGTSRNGSCKPSETDCGHTFDTWHMCCPGASHCFMNKGNSGGLCCPTSERDCWLDVDGECADKTAKYFYYHTEGICCTNEEVGFYLNTSTSDLAAGCAADIRDVASNARRMDTPETFTFTSAIGSTATSTETNTAGHRSSHSTNVDAIVGGVVGGVSSAVILVGLAWLLLRRRKDKSQNQQDGQTLKSRELPAELDEENAGIQPTFNEASGEIIPEMDSRQDSAPRRELDDPKGGVMRVLPELDSHKNSEAVELP